MPVASVSGVRRGDRIDVNYGNSSQSVRVRRIDGETLHTTPWRWYHTVAAWPRRVARKARGWAEDLWLKYWPDPEDDGAEILGEDW